MKRHYFLISIFLISKSLLAGEPLYPKGFEPKKTTQSITFTENKGQVSDQNNKPRPDVLFGGYANGMVFHLRNNGISYQLNRVDSWKEEDSLLNPHYSIMPGEKRKIPDQIKTYRVDVNWLKCNKEFKIIYDDSLPGYTNYYHEVCPDGARHVKTYTGVTYKNIYNGIDLHYYEKDGVLKYDYIVAPHSNYNQIQLEIKGAEKITLQKDGLVLIKTKLGSILEDLPIVYQNKKQLKATWKVKNNILSFEVKEYDPRYKLLIDPAVRIWGTYIGISTSYSTPWCAKTDLTGDVFVSGATNINTGTLIATNGSHQSTLGGNIDAYLMKFHSGGTLLWGTYYGGIQSDGGYGCATDNNGNVFLAGGTGSSGTILATPGSHQVSSGGGSDAFLVKFNTSGIRLWGTYYGGMNNEISRACHVNSSGDVFLTGYTTTNTGTVIATAGSHQSLLGGMGDAFLVKFNNAGVRQWSTYYGGADNEDGFSVGTDQNGNVYISGTTLSADAGAISSAGHQSNYSGSTDAFLVKFSSAGIRQWGTYYGGTSGEMGMSCSSDALGNIYLGGLTSSGGGTIIATSSAHQSNFGGNTDAFLVKFNNNGIRQWGTYYGGIDFDRGWICVTDVLGNTLLAGGTLSSAGIVIATPQSHQSTYGGGTRDAFMAKFDNAGIRQWGTYYGGTNFDEAYACTEDGTGNIYLAGSGTSTNNIASAGAYQTSPGQSFLAKFNDNCLTPAAPVNSTTPINQFLCANNMAILIATGSGTISWYSSPSGTTVLGTGTVFTTPALATGNYTFYAEDMTCAPSASRTAITITVHPTPTLAVSNGAICLGQSFTINPIGANTYTISGGNFVVSPSLTTNYSVTGTSTAGCLSNEMICSVTVNPLPNVTAVSNFSSICLGESAMLTASGANNYVWNPTGNTNTILVTPNATSIYTVTGTDNNGCSNSATVSINIKPNPTVSVNNATVCNGMQAVLNTNVNPSTGIIYTWLPGGESSASINVNPGSTSVYSVVVNLDGCTSMTTSTVNVVSSITPNTNFAYTGFYCSGQINASPNLDPTFSAGGVFNSSSGLNVNPTTGVINLANTTAGTYLINYYLSASGCSTSASSSASIQITEPSSLNLAPQINILTGESTTLSVSGASSYTWSPPDYLSCTTCSNPIANPPMSMTYCVNSPDDACVAKTCISIHIETGCEEQELTLPNAFTPNGDGSNDEYCLRGWNECIAEFKIIIYNRWGEKVYESEQTEFCWDGSYKGKTQETEVFVYMLKAKLKDGTQISKNGNITLLR